MKRDAPSEAIDVGREGMMEGLGTALDAANIAVPGTGWALTKAIQGGNVLRKRRLATKQVREGGALADDGTAAAGEEMYEQITRIVHPA